MKIIIPLFIAILFLSIIAATESFGDTRHCKSGFEILLKATTKAQVCVKPSTSVKLIERGWGILPEQNISDTTEANYNPKIVPNDFTSQINNEFFTLIPGTTFIYESQGEDGTEHNEVVVTNDTKVVIGVSTIVVWDRVWLDDELTEETFDWYAQDSSGNVWYFGEDSKEYESGEIVNTKGSWEAGVDGAEPGIIMLAKPTLGEPYHQEYYKGKAEDMGQVVGINEKVDVPFGTFDNCIKTKDWSALDPQTVELKYYCPQVWGVTLETDQDGSNRVELVDIKKLNSNS